MFSKIFFNGISAVIQFWSQNPYKNSGFLPLFLKHQWKIDDGFNRGYTNRLISQREGDSFCIYLFLHLITTLTCEVGPVMISLWWMRKQRLWKLCLAQSYRTYMTPKSLVVNLLLGLSTSRHHSFSETKVKGKDDFGDFQLWTLFKFICTDAGGREGDLAIRERRGVRRLFAYGDFGLL